MYVCRRSTFSVSFCILFECKVNVLTYIVIDSNIHFIATLIVKNTNIVYYLTTLTIMFSKPTAVSQAWLAHPTRPNFRDKEVKFHGENWQFPAFMQARSVGVPQPVEPARPRRRHGFLVASFVLLVLVPGINRQFVGVMPIFLMTQMPLLRELS